MTYLAFMSLQIIYSHATQPCAWINNCDGVDWCPTDACTQWVIALFKESHTSISDEQYNIEIKVKSVFLTPHGIVLVLCPFHYFFICCKSLKLLKSNCDISTLIKAHVASCPFSVDTRGIVILLPPYPRSWLDASATVFITSRVLVNVPGSWQEQATGMLDLTAFTAHLPCQHKCTDDTLFHLRQMLNGDKRSSDWCHSFRPSFLAYSFPFPV